MVSNLQTVETAPSEVELDLPGSDLVPEECSLPEASTSSISKVQIRRTSSANHFSTFS
jgi:hypothetical protein